MKWATAHLSIGWVLGWARATSGRLALGARHGTTRARRARRGHWRVGGTGAQAARARRHGRGSTQAGRAGGGRAGVGRALGLTGGTSAKRARGAQARGVQASGARGASGSGAWGARGKGAVGARQARDLGAGRVGWPGLCTWCTQPVFGPV